MKIVVFGATGRAGGQVVSEALRRGHEVTGIDRRSESVVQPAPGLTIVTGDVMKPGEVAEIVRAQDAVVSTIGPRESGPTTVAASSSRSIVEALHGTGVRRLVVVSASGFHTDGDGPMTKALVKPMLGRFLRHGFADMRVMEELVMGSDTDWTIVRPPMLTQGRATRNYRSAIGVNVRGGIRISRADLADAILNALDDPTTIHQSVSVAN